jgi:hypothetical protein
LKDEEAWFGFLCTVVSGNLVFVFLLAPPAPFSLPPPPPTPNHPSRPMNVLSKKKYIMPTFFYFKS